MTEWRLHIKRVQSKHGEFSNEESLISTHCKLVLVSSCSLYSTTSEDLLKVKCSTSLMKVYNRHCEKGPYLPGDE